MEIEGYTKETFAEAVKLIRQKAGCSQRKLAELMSVSDQTIRLWENARRLPRNPKETIMIMKFEIEQWQNWKKYDKNPRFKIVRRINPEFIDFVRNMRETAKLTISELAKKMGENEWDLLALERGKKEPKEKDEFMKKLRTITKSEIKRNRELKKK